MDIDNNQQGPANRTRKALGRQWVLKHHSADIIFRITGPLFEQHPKAQSVIKSALGNALIRYPQLKQELVRIRQPLSQDLHHIRQPIDSPRGHMEIERRLKPYLKHHPEVSQAFAAFLLEEIKGHPLLVKKMDGFMRTLLPKEKAYSQGAVDGFMNDLLKTSSGATEVASFLTRHEGAKVAGASRTAAKRARLFYDKNITNLMKGQGR